MAAQGFFDRQASARRNTGWLVCLFAIAVVLIALAVCGAGFLLTNGAGDSQSFPAWLLSRHGLITAGTVIALIGGASALRWLDLSGGGSRVARMVGARLMDPSTSDSDETRLRNVVEEMAIASGVTVPQLYVMDQETSINAFVAGYGPNEAVMVVTHGTLTQLTRDELQGVVAHEFSHILNGDMRLNVRLIALLAGILMIGQVGSFLLRGSRFRSYSRRGRGQGWAVAAGLALIVIGYLGVFFGRLIQAGVARQREMLADASSVQFTRNPEGIAGAIYKIGLRGGYLDSTSHASDMNHLCIGESARVALSGLLASHPPIETRINAIQPGMLARLRSRLRDTTPVHELDPEAPESPNSKSGISGRPWQDLTSGFTAGRASSVTDNLSSQAGKVSDTSEAYARQILRRMPATFRNLLYTRAGAIQLCYALLLSPLGEQTRAQRLAQLTNALPYAPDVGLLDRFLPTLDQRDNGFGFVALELAMPALRKLDPEEARHLIGEIHRLIRADGRISLFELALASFLQKHLAQDAERAVPVRYRSYAKVQNSLARIFSLMARAGADNEQAVKKLYTEAMAGFSSAGESPAAPQAVAVNELREALGHLNQLAPVLKPAVIDACGQCVLSDGRIEAREYTLLRLVADQLDCPMPPLLGAAA
ncbi:MAG: M48 family metallopeptidase [Oleiphilaceae bacterium]|nr:M48 family metallopeptidase [Oleiphilaceae bacterium]